jgi:hypothetical protein
VTPVKAASLSGPRGIPDEIIKKLNEETNRFIQLPHVEKQLERDAFDIRHCHGNA